MRFALVLLIAGMSWAEAPEFCVVEAPAQLQDFSVERARVLLNTVTAWRCENAWVVLKPAHKVGGGRMHPEFARDLEVAAWAKQLEERGDPMIVAVKRGKREYIRTFLAGRFESSGDSRLVKWNSEFGLLWISGMTRATDSRLTHPVLEMRIDRKGVDIGAIPFGDVCSQIRQELGIESARVRLVAPGGLNRYLPFEPLLMMLKEPWEDQGGLHVQPELRDCDCHYGVGKCRSTDSILPQARPSP